VRKKKSNNNAHDMIHSLFSTQRHSLNVSKEYFVKQMLIHKLP
jgi:hypothetical protein